MKKHYLLLLTVVLLISGNTAFSQTLIHYWNFNSLASGTLTNVPADSSAVVGAEITYPGTGAGYLDRVDPGDAQNARLGDPAGYGLRPRNPSDTREFLFAMPTTGYSDIKVQFTTARTGSGATEQYYDYSLDGGSNYITTGLSTTTFYPNQEPSYDVVTLDFTGITGVNNNPDFVVRVRFGGANASGGSGNNRFDNITLESGPFPSNTEVEFDEEFVVVNEDHGTLSFDINITDPSTCSVDLVVKGAPFSTADAGDFTLATQTLNFTSASPGTHTVSIPIIDDTDDEQHAEYFVLSLENAVNCTIDGDTLATVYIRDNDRMAPAAMQDVELQYVGSYDPSGTGNSTCEIVVHDPATQRLFATSGVSGYLDIINFSNPASPSLVTSVNMSTYGGITSVAVYNGVLAVASPNANEQANGSVVFFDIDGNYLNQLAVGALPDMVTFTHDGAKVLVANEGQPNDDYTVDPEGSVSVIDMSAGAANLTQGDVSMLWFTQFNAMESTLMAAGVRKVMASSTLSEDIEPEYITVSENSQTAWVTLQENNAIAVVDLVNDTITEIFALGTKDFSAMGNGFDASDDHSEILIANWPVNAYYIPDAVASYTYNNTTYLVTANEGDEKDYSGFSERKSVGSGSYDLDPSVFPNAQMLKDDNNLGRFRVTSVNGDLGNDNDYDEMYCLGARSFSIWNADNQSLVYDSGDDFEMYIAHDATYSAIFNADNEDNDLKGRSRAKGPEPEGVTIAELSGNKYAFIALERVGGVMVYDITDPQNVKFMDYKNSRSTSTFDGDNGAESLIFISATNGPNANHYLVVANEISGTLSIYEVVDNNQPTSVNDKAGGSTFNIFPNPSNGDIVYFNRMASVEIYDITGKMVHSAANAQSIDVSGYESGMYFVRTTDGAVKQMIVR